MIRGQTRFRYSLATLVVGLSLIAVGLALFGPVFRDRDVIRFQGPPGTTVMIDGQFVGRIPVSLGKSQLQSMGFALPANGKLHVIGHHTCLRFIHIRRANGTQLVVAFRAGEGEEFARGTTASSWGTVNRIWGTLPREIESSVVEPQFVKDEAYSGTNFSVSTGASRSNASIQFTVDSDVIEQLGGKDRASDLFRVRGLRIDSLGGGSVRVDGVSFEYAQGPDPGTNSKVACTVNVTGIMPPGVYELTVFVEDPQDSNKQTYLGVVLFDNRVDVSP